MHQHNRGILFQIFGAFQFFVVVQFFRCVYKQEIQIHREIVNQDLAFTINFGNANYQLLHQNFQLYKPYICKVYIVSQNRYIGSPNTYSHLTPRISKCININTSKIMACRIFMYLISFNWHNM